MGKKIFISYKMDGLTDEEILREKEWLSQYIKSIMGDDVDIIDSYIESDAVFDHLIYKKNSNTVKCNALTYLGGSLSILSIADYLYISENAAYCRGCQIEKAAAQAYGIPVLKNLSKRIEIDSYIIDVFETGIHVGIRNFDDAYQTLFDQPITHETFTDWYELAINEIQKYNKDHELVWNQIPNLKEE